jgi:beta-galactosidase
MTRRDWIKNAGLMGGAALLPNVTGLLGAQGAATPAAQGGPAAAARPVMTAGRERLLADFGWRFHLGHANDPALDFGYGRTSGSGAFAKAGSLIAGGRGTPSPTQVTFNDGEWQAVDLPHDWAVDLPFVNDRSLNAHGAKQLGRSFPETSIGWYRRAFDIPASDLGRRIALEFDGVFRDCLVILNGHYIGRNLSGYSPFRFDVTDFLTYATRNQAGEVTGPGKNVLLLRVDATENEGWFYEGAGMYRHVWLDKTAPLHVAHWGTFVTSDVRAGAATVTIQTEVQNEADAAATCHVTSKLLDADGRTVATVASAPVSIGAWGRRTFTQQAAVARPRLWSIDEPHLYRLVTTIEDAKGTADRYETPFGVRTVHFDADKGFFLNGKPVKIKGTCNHQDHAGVGAGLPDRLQYFRIEKLKAMGSNAYRTSHNPPTPELLDACDRLGMLVLDETRMMASNEEGLSQLERLIRRDRNHPSVFCWSIGNEEPEQGTERGAREAATMKRRARELDPSRLVTEAMNNSWGRGLSAVVDIQGFNYGHAQQIDNFHQQFPKQLTMGTEVASTVSTRGIYANDAEKGYVSAYDRNFPSWASTAEEWWSTYNARPWVAGGFVWTGFDYRGEPTPYNWPCISSHFGIIDMCGFPKDLFYYYQAWWSGQPVLHLFPHWNWAGKEGQEVEVWCFTNLDRVELLVNGATAGLQEVKKDSHVMWKVPYAPGAIEARGYRGDVRTLVSSARQPVPVLVERRETTGAPAKIVLRPDRATISADGEDLSVVEAQIVDAQGRVVPTAGHEVTFTVAGPGRIIGAGNGDPSSHEPDRTKPGQAATMRSAFNGLCMALVQSGKQPGDIRIEASSPGLAGATATITASAATTRPAM